MANIDTLKSVLYDTADAIREKTGRSTLIDFPDFPDEVRSIETGGGNVPNPDDPLLLVDWDGTTLLYSYTYEDAQLISEFPDPPTHEGLTFQSWNWSEVIAKTWLQNHRGAQLKVGATYTPTDGQDHNYWRSPRLTEPNQIYMQHRATTSVRDNEFYERRFLTAISLPNSLTAIGASAFYYCDSLTSISLPNGLTSIGNTAFQSCYSLTSISLPSSLTTIGNDAFRECHTLVAISFPSSLTAIGTSAFYRCYSLTAISLPNSLTTISGYAFQSCHSLTSVSLPSGLTTISNNAFQYCYSLNSISLPNSLATISGYAFIVCISLYKMDIPASVTLIGSYAFNGCTSLVDVVIRGTPALEGSVVFGNNPSNQRFYVHRADLEWYSTATNWSAIYGEDKIVAAADYIDYLQSIGIDTTDFEGE